QLAVPAEVNVGDFIVSGGLLQTPPRSPAPIVFSSTQSLIDRYLECRRHTAADTYYASQAIHLRHFSKFLGRLVDRPCNLVTQEMVERSLLGRLKIRNPETVKRERPTLTHLYRWIETRSDVPAFPSPAMSLPVFKSSTDRPPFR